MPTVLLYNGFRFFSYSNDHLPIHFHVEKQSAVAKFNLVPVELIKSSKFSAKQLKEIRSIIEAHLPLLIAKWNEYFTHQ